MAKPVNPRKPRIAVTLNQDCLDVVTDVARLTKRPTSAVIADLMGAAMPGLLATRDALQIIDKHPEEAERMLTRYANARIAALAEAQLEFGQFVDQRARGRKRRRDS